MPRRFLPKPAPGVDYTITGNTTGFSSEPWALLRNLGLNIGVQQARTENRIPSPVSRAYVFYSNLHGVAFGTASNVADGDDEKLASQGRGALQAEARRAFRGMLTAFALRDAVGLRVALERVYIQPQQDALSDVLRAALTSAPGGEAFWNPMRILKASTPDGRTAVIGGLSPLTGFFPAASPASALRSLYWYDPGYTAATGAQPVGRWYDPTSGDVSERQQIQIAPATTMRVRALMGAWVSHILAEWRRQPQLLSTCGLSPRDESALKREFEVWIRDIGPAAGDDLPEPRSAPLGDAPDASMPFFLNWTIGGPDERIASDFSMTADGRAIVTLDDLQRPRLRLFGRQFGSLGLEAAGEHLRAQGINLGRDLGLGETAVPIPYVCLDRLFTPHLTVLTTHGFSPEWSGMAVDEHGKEIYGLYPFEPEILTVLSPEQIRQTTARMSQDSQSYFVELPLGNGTQIVKRYSVSAGGSHTLDSRIATEQFDLRLFPNIDLRAVRPHMPKLSNGEMPDDVYYARVRRLPEWRFRTVPIDETGKAIGTETVLGSESVPSGADRAPGQASFFEIRGAHPVGFSMEQRGLCFLTLRDPRTTGIRTDTWAIGVDFGTSNTCVSFARMEGELVTGEPTVLSLPVFTTTLLKIPNYTNVSDGTVDEGASAVMDFFTRFGDREVLNPDGHFPSQILTQQPSVIDDKSFNLANGLAFFENLCLTDPKFLMPVKPFPAFSLAAGGPRLHKRFTLKRDIKWEQQEWLRAYLQHLRKQINLTAASEGARVAEVRISYPRSFGTEKANSYLKDFKSAWSDSIAGHQSLSVRMHTMTESEASQGQIVAANHGYVVFDIGGGTTDITGYSTKSPVFQTSFRLAAGALNRYVVQSVGLRETLIAAVRSNLPKATERFIGGGGGESASIEESSIAHWFVQKAGADMASRETLETLWIAVLQAAEQENGLNSVLTDLRQQASSSGAKARAVRGYFVTLALLFGGSAYLGGILMRLAAKGKFAHDDATRAISAVQLELTGNGGKLYGMLGGDGFTFGKVFARMFRHGFDAVDGPSPESPGVGFKGLYQHRDKPAPKASVSLGLLATNVQDVQATTDSSTVEQGLLDEDAPRIARIPVANVAAERGWTVANMVPTAVEDDLYGFYQCIHSRKTDLALSLEPGETFMGFLDALERELPQGRLEANYAVVPGVDGNWLRTILAECRTEMRDALHERLISNADAIQKYATVSNAEKPAFEPLFVAELAALLDAVRTKYAA